MINGLKLIVVMPAYNAGKTLQKTFEELPHEIIDEIILVDDCSRDDTVQQAQTLGIQTVVTHEKNQGYGGNQKTCYTAALKHGADIVVMIHPDYQYSPKLCGAMAQMIASGVYEVCLGSRILGNDTLRGGMPIWKYVSNRVLTAIENMLLGIRVSEYHTGYRAFSRHVLETLPLEFNSDDFVFDNQMLAQCAFFGLKIGELSCPTVYFAEASSINFGRSVTYGFGVLTTAVQFWLNKRGFRHDAYLSTTTAGRLNPQSALRGIVVRDAGSSTSARPYDAYL